jgi:diguanylate cyclase (GGDEF)-like protein
MPVLDVPGIDGIVVRHRPWEEQRHFDRFLIALLADDPLCEVLDALAQSISASVQAAGATIHHGFDGRSFAAVAGSGVPDACRSLDEGPWSDVVAVGAATYLDVDDLAEPVAAAARSAGFGACWTLPVTLASGLAPAVLTIWRGPSGGPLLGHRRVLERAARHVQLALVRTAEHERLRHLAGHDALTGVANRLQFHDRLARALAIGERDLAVAFCDLDRFKVVNDTWGHRVGDDILVQAAERVRSCLRVGDELARMGGDEFTILLRALPDRATADQVITRLRAAFCEPFRIGGSEADLGLSVGIALARPDSTADSLLSEADAALYQAKHLRAHEPRPS